MSNKTRQYEENVNKPRLKGNKRSKNILQKTEQITLRLDKQGKI